MSKARQISDVERTSTMVDLLRREYESQSAQILSHVVVEEVAPGTGVHSNRYADLVALSVWPSSGLTLHGYEVKASRSDLRRELADLSKHRAVARFCDWWTLVVWDADMFTDFIEQIPREWGISVTQEGEHGRELVDVRKATRQTPDEWTRVFVCSLVRNAYQQSAGAAYVARAVLEAHRHAERNANDARDAELRGLLRPLTKALFPQSWGDWSSHAENPADLIRMAVERIASANPVEAVS